MLRVVRPGKTGTQKLRRPTRAPDAPERGGPELRQIRCVATGTERQRPAFFDEGGREARNLFISAKARVERRLGRREGTARVIKLRNEWLFASSSVIIPAFCCSQTSE